jgi:hypothetical protein
MKKPVGGESDRPRTLTEEPNDEFRKLEQQYDNASIEERDRLWPSFIRAVREKYPGRMKESWQALRNGVSLKAALRQAMKRVLDRNDLSVGRKTNAREDADSAMWLFDELQRKDLGPREMRRHAYELATRTLFIGLRAGPSPIEVENLHAKFMSDRQRKLGAIAKKEKPWMRYARMLARKIPEKDRTLPKTTLASKLWDMWTEQKPAEWAEAKPTRPKSWDTIVDFVGKLQSDGTLPTGPTRARRPR